MPGWWKLHTIDQASLSIAFRFSKQHERHVPGVSIKHLQCITPFRPAFLHLQITVSASRPYRCGLLLSGPQGTRHYRDQGSLAEH